MSHPWGNGYPAQREVDNVIKYRLTIDGRAYDVQIQDLDADPVVVLVDGKRFDVTRSEVETAPAHSAPAESQPPIGAAPPTPIPLAQQGPAPSAGGAIRAPMPGTVLEMKVRPGDKVEYGQEIGVLEAMKMKSALRAERAGTVRAVRVTAGQSVAHGDVLLTFE